jgi:ssDNA-binding Zn-finger/Zn-ribbon topoisomerase 1
MNAETWHTDFNPQKFLSRVRLAQLIERNEAYNESSVTDAKSPCIFCGKESSCGIYLNDKTFLCQQCYSEVALIAYPEKYEALRRQFVISREARCLAWECFAEKFEHKSEKSSLVFWGLTSLLLAPLNLTFLVLTTILLVIGYAKNVADQRKTDRWLARKSAWEQANPEPLEPELKHFHDPSAHLTEKDRLVLKIFNNWPGYPPFWTYLRAVVINRDSNRCQVTGCPSRLGLHVHHIRPVSMGGSHTPDNLVSLCDFHHALEPEKGHERIWRDIKTRYFTLVCSHERSNRALPGTHAVRTHLRRLQLVTMDELRELTNTYGFHCPTCSEPKIKFSLFADKNIIRVECPNCNKSTEGAQQLTEETGPMLAEILAVSRNKGRWKARWDMLAERKGATWGAWSGQAVSAKRKEHKDKVEARASALSCPKCGSPMKLVRPRPTDTWKTFWGCTQYSVTGCKGSAKYVATKG